MNENKVLITGKVGMMKVFQSQGGLHIVKFGLCRSSKSKKPGSEWTYQWFNCVSFGETAELIKKDIIKGSKIYLEGYLKQNKWEDKKTGESRTSIEIIINSFRSVTDELNNSYFKDKVEQPQKVNKDNNDFDDETIPF